MKKKKKEETKSKKIRRPKLSRLNDKRFDDTPVGRIPNIQKELTSIEKNLCYFVAIGMSRQEIMKRLDITAHIYRKSEKDERFVEEIERVQSEKQVEEGDLWLERKRNRETVIHNEFIDLVTTKEARKNLNYFKEISKQDKDAMVSAGVYQPSEGELTEIEKRTQIKRVIPSQKRLPHKSEDSEEEQEPSFFTSEETESTEELEQSVEITKTKGKKE
ncbi:hypothetical protein LCGC14_1987330 [marine sediment metagenome]|uniref:Uncharacterized protein n=1 Tax=marine sediment metagenome TaxID=412755 RepID=A0A0F9HKF5_9ZZZZ